MLFMLCFCTFHVAPVVTMSYHQALIKEQYHSEINSLMFHCFTVHFSIQQWIKHQHMHFLLNTILV